MLAPVMHILPVTTIQRERILPMPGRVVVRRGQRVKAGDAVAETHLKPEHIILDVARGLGISASEMHEHIQRKSGERVGEGDIIAGPVGIAKRVVRAPHSGRVILIRGGKVLFELNSSPFVLKAGIPGVVSSLIPERGVIIEGTGGLIQGVWGNGRIDYGLLLVQARTPEDMLMPDQLDNTMRGSVILAGFCEDAEVLEAAGELPVRGLILSSMASSLIPVAVSMEYPIIVMEGFGLLPMNSAAFKLLSSSDQREVALNADVFDQFANTRPEIVIPLPTEDNVYEPRESLIFSPNQRVHIVRAPYKSQIGTITALRQGTRVLPSNVRAPAAEISLESGETVVLPLANLEVLA
jgi:hypothetical protein